MAVVGGRGSRAGGVDLKIGTVINTSGVYRQMEEAEAENRRLVSKKGQV